MPNLKQIVFATLLVLALLSTAAAQDASSTQRSSLTITAAAAGKSVRITAPSSIVQMHVEVYAASGEKLFDQEIRGGNVFDWHLQDGQGQRLAVGDYVCVVTAKSVSGKLTQKIGSVKVEETAATVQLANSQQLSAPQTQAIGPVEQDSSWTIAAKDEPQTPTVIANDGTDGQMIRGRGALSFRIGDFFSGNDQEQMRLTEAGNLGLGTAEPKAKLDVAGTIRAERFLIAKPRLGGGDKAGTSTLETNSADSVQPMVAGSGNTGQLTKWTDGNNGTLGDSVVTESNLNIGINTTGPVGKLDVVQSAAVSSINQTNAGLNVENSSSNGDAMISLTGGGAGGSGLITAMTTAQAALPLRLYTGTVERLRIAASGNVGVGTPAPVGKLDIVQSASVSTINQTNAGLNVENSNSNGDAMITLTGGAAGGSGVITAMTSAQKSLPLRFYVGTKEGMRIDRSGSVGIGTDNPYEKLEVVATGRIAVSGSSDDQAGVAGYSGTGVGVIGNSDGNLGIAGTSDTGWGIYGSTEKGSRGVYGFAPQGDGVYGESWSRNGVYGQSRGSTGVYGKSDSGNGVFGVTTDGIGVFGQSFNNYGVYGLSTNNIGVFGQSTGGDAGRFDGKVSVTGNVGIGTNAATGVVRLQVEGGPLQSIYAHSINDIGLHARSEQSWAGYFEGTTYFSRTITLDELDSPGFPVQLCRNDNTHQVSFCSSSLRYKTQVQPFLGGLNIINRLRPISFTWKQGGARDLGLGAEEVERVEPLLTFRNQKGEIEGVRYNQLSAVFVNAIKEQQAQLSQQQDQLKQQQEQIKRQEEQAKEQRAALSAQQQQLEALKKLTCRSHRRNALCR